MANYNIIDYVTVASTGNASDFGDLTAARLHAGGMSNGIRGVFAGGSDTNIMDYVTIATTGNATDFGNLTAAHSAQGTLSNTIRGVMAGGWTSLGNATHSNVIQYITVATTGNASDFGDLTKKATDLGGCASSTRGVFCGGAWGTGSTTGNDYDIIEYITIATTGNSTDFGDLSRNFWSSGVTSNSVTGIVGGGYNGSTYTNIIEQFTIASTGNATDFGDLTVARGIGLTAASNADGGI
tara:strand:- start:411 stop:1127 length:717 start_codon:yes stop_codon:yes gene_type:complete